jgi:hypothetical protein
MIRVACISLLLASAVGCQTAKDTYRGVVGPEAGRHRVTVTNLALSESDFTKSALGSPKDIEIRALKDGAEIFKTKVEGFRGPKALGTPTMTVDVIDENDFNTASDIFYGQKQRRHH